MPRRWLAWLALVACLAALLPVAQKAVIECTPDRWGNPCTEGDQVVVTYRLLTLNARTSHASELETLPGDRHGAVHWYLKDIPHEQGNTPLLSWAGLGVLATAPAAAVLLQARRRAPAVVAFGALLAAEAAFALGLVYHSGSWVGASVSLLTPHVGTVALLVAPMAGLTLLDEPEPALPSLPPLDHNAQGR